MLDDAPSLTITPAGAALDTPLRIRVEGAGPGAILAITTSQLHAGGRSWSASAKFVADEQGVVDTTSDAPLTGSYEGVDAMGLVWSMIRQDRPPSGMPGSLLDPAVLRVTAQSARGTVEASSTRARLPDGVQRIPVTAPGVIGVLFHPETGGPHPGVLLLGGSEGGLHEMDAALLAAHGFSVLALAYFGTEGVPAALVEVPLESFGTAIELMLAHAEVRGDRVGVLGGSRGGEAALLVGATFPRVGAVVSTVGSGLVTAGIPRLPGLLDILHANVPSWTWRGRPVPFLPYVVDRELIDQVESGGPVELARAFRPDLASRRDIAVATIEVEHIRGPVLLLSADDDRSWPSAHLSEIAAQRLMRVGHPFPYQHVRYTTAGHAIAPPPYGPTDLVVPGPGVGFAMGGTIAATSAARADAWLRTIEWFTEHLPA
jgi:dienelactone hydrolase